MKKISKKLINELLCKELGLNPLEFTFGVALKMINDKEDLFAEKPLTPKVDYFYLQNTGK